ncbi:MAG: phosphopyruvate hydratase [Clostridia bacterium]|nr:phosphopyruvate hydratase [Clostridia bacterium]
MQRKIARVGAREILDSRGNPTVEASVYLTDGTVGVASVPSGASTGKYEAHELRDGDSARFGGRGVLRAVDNIRRIISPALVGADPFDQFVIDSTMISLDGTRDKASLGANATLAVSLAAARAAACCEGVPLYRYLGGVRACRLPVPMMNILNGGAHAANNLEVQEFMILPLGAADFEEGVRMCCDVYRTLGTLLKRAGKSTTVGDEGGYAPDLSGEEEALSLICEAIVGAGYSTDAIGLALDAAASEWWQDGETGYRLPKTNVKMTSDALIDRWDRLIEEFPIVSIEDGLGEDDGDGWRSMTQRLGGKIMLVGDDLFVTNTARLAEGMDRGWGNAILVKPNQIGTLTEVLSVVDMATAGGYRHILSHRSGETEDTSIADLAVATGAPFIKAGAPARGERVAKYNRLSKIGRVLGDAAEYGMA